MRIAGENGITRLGGPMLGVITSDGAERSFGPVKSTAETDLTAIVQVSGLQPGTHNPYRVLVDGKPVSIPEHASINTLPGESQPQKVRIAFGSCFHQWGPGNHNQSGSYIQAF